MPGFGPQNTNKNFGRPLAGKAEINIAALAGNIMFRSMGVKKMKSLQELEAIRNKMQGKIDIRKNDAEKRVVVGMATCGTLRVRPVLQAFVDEVATRI